MKKAIILIISLSCIFGLLYPLNAQEFVDEPVEPIAEEPVNTEGTSEPIKLENIKTYHQFSSGFLSYGWDENVFYQFTGDSTFSDGISPSSFFVNLQYETITSLNNPYIKAISTSWEWYRLNTNSDEVALKEGTNPSLKLSVDQIAFSVKSYFLNDMSPTEDSFKMLKLFFGLGWGWLDGKFTGTNIRSDSSIQSIDTDIYGPLTYRELGIAMIGETYGGLFSFKILRADQTKTSSDPFNQAEEGDRLILNLGGISTTLAATVRF